MESYPSSTPAVGQADKQVQVMPPHSAGLTRLVYPPHLVEGPDRIFTGGDDSLVRLLPGLHDANEPMPLQIGDATQPITWIDVNDNCLVTASMDGMVRLYEHNDPNGSGNLDPTDMVSVVTRCTLAVRCAALERYVGAGRSPRIAVCSDELTIKVIAVDDNHRAQLLTGHERGLRAASWCPTAPILASASCDGTVKVWDLSSTEPRCVQTLHNIMASSTSDAEINATPIWHPSGQFFLLPAKTHEIVMCTREADWQRGGIVPGVPDDCAVRPPTGAISAMAFSLNGLYLAVSTTDGNVMVWDWTTKRPFAVKQSRALVTALAWHPKHNLLAWADNDGQLSRWNHPVDSERKSPYDLAFLPVTRQAAHTIGDLDDPMDFDDDDDAFGSDLEQETAIDLDGDERRSHRSRRPRARFSSCPALDALSVKPQPTFQPTSTPMRDNRRYLAFNTIGSLVAIDQTSHQTVSFESFDTSARRNWRFVDQYGCNMASIGAQGALMASPEKKGLDRDEEDEEDEDEDEEILALKRGHPSKIHFKPFEDPSASYTMPGSEWTVDLPKGERAVALAMAGRRSTSQMALDNCTALVATSEGYLRFFSGAGLQRYIWAFGTQVLAMAAGNRFALVLHRQAAPSTEHQNLLYTLIDVTSFEIRQEGVVPLVQGATVTWIGFSETDVPALFDSRGVLYLLDRALATAGQARWIPGLDTRPLQRHHGFDEAQNERHVHGVRFWPVGLDGTTLMAIMLKGQAYPDASATSRPLIQELTLAMPVVNSTSEMGALEEKVLRQNQLASLARNFRSSLLPDEEEDEYYADLLAQVRCSTLERDADKDLLQLIKEACKGNRHQLAIDAARELHATRTLEAAVQIGNYFRLPAVVDRVTALRSWVEDRRERDERLTAGLPFASLAGGMTNDAISGGYGGATTGRVLVNSSPGPAMTSTSNDRNRAKQALRGDFASRSFGGRAGAGSELAKLGQSPQSTWAHSIGTVNSSMPQGATVRGETQATYDDGMDDSDQERGSPRANKRRADATGEGYDRADQDDDDAMHKRARESLTTSPFANKTNRSTFAQPAAPAQPTTAKNPFARTAGMTRDRSMHKSNSFFDRVDNMAATTAAASATGRTGSTAARTSSKTKQATLFGMMGGQSGGAASKRSAIASPTVVATPAFAQDSLASEVDGSSEESLRLTLETAQQRDRESQVVLEETQFTPDEEEEESQPAHAGGLPPTMASPLISA